MAAETDPARVPASLSVAVPPGSYTLVPVDQSISLGNGVEALIREEAGVTAVVALATARGQGWPVGFAASCLTVEAHTTLEAVGLTAALAGVLSAEGIPPNVLAGAGTTTPSWCPPIASNRPRRASPPSRFRIGERPPRARDLRCRSAPEPPGHGVPTGAGAPTPGSAPHARFPHRRQRPPGLACRGRGPGGEARLGPPLKGQSQADRRT